MTLVLQTNKKKDRGVSHNIYWLNSSLLFDKYKKSVISEIDQTITCLLHFFSRYKETNISSSKQLFYQDFLIVDVKKKNSRSIKGVLGVKVLRLSPTCLYKSGADQIWSTTKTSEEQKKATLISSSHINRCATFDTFLN